MSVTTRILDRPVSKKRIDRVTNLEDGELFETSDGTKGIKTFGGWITFSEGHVPVAFVDNELDDYPQYYEVSTIDGQLDITFTIQRPK